MWETKVIVSDTPSVLIYKTQQELVNNTPKFFISEVVCWDCRHALTSGGYLLAEPTGSHLSRAHCIICQAIFK